MAYVFTLVLSRCEPIEKAGLEVFFDYAGLEVECWFCLLVFKSAMDG